MSLRLTLLLAGLALLALIYVVSVLQRRRRRYPRVRREPRLQATDPSPGDSDDEIAARADEERLPDPDDLPARPLPPALTAGDTEDLGELPTLRRDTDDDEVAAPATRERKRRGRKRDDQMELNFDSAGEPAVPEEAAEPAAAAGPEPEPVDAPAAANSEPEQLLVIYLKAPGGAAFPGKALREALDLVDMHLGPMNIFHHYGVGAMQSRASLFSAANMFEPGTFDPDTMDAADIGGVAMFLPLPSQVEGAVAFELFLSTTQRLADRLGATLLNASHKGLSTADIDSMRQAAAGY